MLKSLFSKFAFKDPFLREKLSRERVLSFWVGSNFNLLLEKESEREKKEREREKREREREKLSCHFSASSPAFKA